MGDEMSDLLSNATNMSTSGPFVPNVYPHFIESKWNQLLDVIGDDPNVLYVWFMTTYTYSFFWVFGMLFVAMDLTGRPRFLRKYKIQPGTNEPLSWDRFKQLALIVLRNQLLFGVPMSYIVFHTCKQFVTEIPPVRVLPSLYSIAQDMLVCILAWEIFYYYTHRLLHSRHMYRRFHKQHHEWSSPVALAAMYSHPVEFVLSDLVPVYAGPVIMRSHVFTTLIWFTYVMIDTLTDHSDYHLPLMASSEFHDYHHLNFNQCYGNFGLWDLVHGTAKEFLKKKQFQRHHRLFTLRSAHEWIPDKDE